MIVLEVVVDAIRVNSFTSWILFLQKVIMYRIMRISICDDTKLVFQIRTEHVNCSLARYWY